MRGHRALASLWCDRGNVERDRRAASPFAARLWVGVNSAMLAPPVSMPNSRREITSLKQSGPLQDQIDETDLSMSRTELVIQLIKVALGLLIGAYFVWWSLEVLQRLPQH